MWFTAVFNLTSLSLGAGRLLWRRLIVGWRVAVTLHTLRLIDRHYINDRSVDKPVNSSWMQLLICICFFSIIYGLFKTCKSVFLDVKVYLTPMPNVLCQFHLHSRQISFMDKCLISLVLISSNILQQCCLCHLCQPNSQLKQPPTPSDDIW